MNKKAKALEKARKAKKKGPTIKDLVLKLLTAKKPLSNDEIIERVKEEFPDSAINSTHITWYRNKAKKGEITLNGEDVSDQINDAPEKKKDKEEKKSAKKDKKAGKKQVEEDEDEEEVDEEEEVEEEEDEDEDDSDSDDEDEEEDDEDEDEDEEEEDED